MSDAATISLAQLGDPQQYKLLGSVPWFRAHRRKKDDGTEVVVSEADLAEIAEHMQEMEAEGRLFRLTHGHINPAGDEDEQPELLGFARHARVDTFGPEKIRCVMVDEYARVDAVGKLRNRPYRSAEYYPSKKVITGAAALIRDPQLNLGAVLYANNSPWIYSEPIMPDPAGKKEEDDFSPEETQQYERMCKYMSKKFPKVFAVDAPAGNNDTQPDQDPAKKPPVATPPQEGGDKYRAEETPEMYALRQKAEAATREVAQLRQEREKEKCERLVSDLARHYRLDPVREVKALLPLSHQEREAHVAYIRSNYAEIPGAGEPIEIYSGHAESGSGARDSDRRHEAVMAYIRANPGCTHQQAVDAVSRK